MDLKTQYPLPIDAIVKTVGELQSLESGLETLENIKAELGL